MTWRVVVIENRAKLELKLSHLVVRQDGNKDSQNLLKRHISYYCKYDRGLYYICTIK